MDFNSIYLYMEEIGTPVTQQEIAEYMSYMCSMPMSQALQKVTICLNYFDLNKLVSRVGSRYQAVTASQNPNPPNQNSNGQIGCKEPNNTKHA